MQMKNDTEEEQALVPYEESFTYDSQTRPTNPSELGEEEDVGTCRQVGGAAAAGAIAGLVLGGPIIACLAAGGAAAVATSKSQAGDVARKSGDVMANAGDRLKRFDEKHHVVQKTSRGLSKSATWVSKKLQPKEAHRASLTT